MTDPSPSPESRMETLAPGVPIQSKIALLFGLAGGLFVTIVLSYSDPDRQFWGIGIGLALGVLAAAILFVRSRR